MVLNPLSRLFEFTLGISTCLLFRRVIARLKWSTARTTAIELLLLVLCAASMSQSHSLAACISSVPLIGKAGALWVECAGVSAFLFAGLIFVLSTEFGLVSRMLAAPYLVLGGEISFGIYLLHCIFLVHKEIYFPQLRSPLDLALFLATLLVSAHLMHTLLESPLRKLIIKAGDLPLMFSSRGSSRLFFVQFRQIPAWLGCSLRLPLRGVLFTLVEGVVLIALIYLSMPALDRISPSQLEALESHAHVSVRGAEFGNCLRCPLACAYATTDGVLVNLVWQIKAINTGSNIINVQLLNARGETVASRSYVQNARLEQVSPQSLWREHIQLLLPPHTDGKKIAVMVLWGRRHPLTITQGPSDPEHHRLIVPVGTAAREEPPAVVSCRQDVARQHPCIMPGAGSREVP